MLKKRIIVSFIPLLLCLSGCNDNPVLDIIQGTFLLYDENGTVEGCKLSLKENYNCLLTYLDNSYTGNYYYKRVDNIDGYYAYAGSKPMPDEYASERVSHSYKVYFDFISQEMVLPDVLEKYFANPTSLDSTRLFIHTFDSYDNYQKYGSSRRAVSVSGKQIKQDSVYVEIEYSITWGSDSARENNPYFTFFIDQE